MADIVEEEDPSSSMMVLQEQTTTVIRNNDNSSSNSNYQEQGGSGISSVPKNNNNENNVGGQQQLNNKGIIADTTTTSPILQNRNEQQQQRTTMAVTTTTSGEQQNNGNTTIIPYSTSAGSLSTMEEQRQQPILADAPNNQRQTPGGGGIKKVWQLAGRPIKSVKKRLGGSSRNPPNYGSTTTTTNQQYRGLLSSPRRQQQRGVVNPAASSDMLSSPLLMDGSSRASRTKASTTPHHRVSGGSSSRNAQRSGGGTMVLPPGATTTEDNRVAVDGDDTIPKAEGLLRKVLLLLLAFLLGAHFPNYKFVVSKIAEYLIVAWVTCLLLLIVSSWHRRQRGRNVRQQRVMMSISEEEVVPLLMESLPNGNVNNNIVDDVVLSSSPATRDNDDDDNVAIMIDDDDDDNRSETAMIRRSVSGDAAAVADDDWTAASDSYHNKREKKLLQKIGNHHVSLDPYFVLDTATNKRIYPNAFSEVYPLETEYFTGSMLVLIRTPDMDDHTKSPGTNDNELAKQFFVGKQRRFEFQFQVRLRKVPQGRVYFACELNETIKLGLIQRAFVGAAMAFVKSTNNNFHYHLSGTPFSDDGKWESPHMAFPVEEGMNRVVATPPGHAPPVLGQPIHESEASIKQRKKGMQIDWNLQDTYTFSLWSAYVDFLQWRCLNLPGIRPFSITSVIGQQPIILTLYDLKGGGGDNTASGSTKQNHYRCDTVNIVRLEMCNVAESGIGESTRRWMLEHQSATPVAASGLDGNRSLSSDADIAGVEGDAGDDSTGPDGGREEDYTILSEEAAEDLGAGIYVRSGDTIALKECVFDPDTVDGVPSCFISNGGGFAVLQEHESSTCEVVIEKAGRSRLRKNVRPSHRLIRSGDTVSIKLIMKNGDDSQTKYLSTHRGWWLKWVSSIPTKNGFFVVHTHETEFEGDANETQSSYLRLGGSFWLQHKRWSRYRVGVASEASATYGGRMLGLHIPPKDGGGGSNLGDEDLAYQSDDGAELEPDVAELERKGAGEWMMPLQLQVYEPGPLELTNASEESNKADIEREDRQELNLVFSQSQYRMNVPAYVEIMNRQERIRQHAYVVRVIPPDTAEEAKRDDSSDVDEEEASKLGAFVRLRNGQALAGVMKAGLKWHTRAASPGRRKRPPELSDPLSPVNGDIESPNQELVRPRSDGNEPPLAFNSSIHSIPSFGERTDDGEWDAESESEVEMLGSFDELVDTPNSDAAQQHGKGRKLIGKIAKSVKTKTTSAAKSTGNAGKIVLSQSVKGTVIAGKATVNVGKSILPIRPKKPPMREPKSAMRSARKLRDRGLRVVGTSRSIRRSRGVHSFMAGELSPPEQSRRTVSSMVAKMSSQPESSLVSATFSSLLASVVEEASNFDNSFLRGGAVQLGVTPSPDSGKGELLHDSLVARCLWESHWREEWCGLHQNGLVFYAPLTCQPCLEISFADMKSVRFLDDGTFNPLAGYHLLVFETAWLCHYCAFFDEETRQTFHVKVEEARSLFVDFDETTAASERELAAARFWQGFQTSIESSRSVGDGKWAGLVSGSKMKSRAILNSRRMDFDRIETTSNGANEYVEDLLSTALSFTLDSLQQHPEALIQFLDATCHLKTVSMQEIDRDTPQAYCLFVNLYHCLLQHALLFSIDGPLHKGSFQNFMWTSCYEVSGDVFSLAELHSCVIRGNMHRPLSTRPPCIEAPKKSSAYQFYALGFTSANTNFLLNSADASCLGTVPVLTPEEVVDQLDAHAATYIRTGVIVNVRKKIVVLPKVFDVYRNDFTSDASNSGIERLRYCLRYLDDAMSARVRGLLMEDPNSIIVRYRPNSDQYHSSLKRSLPEDSTGFELNLQGNVY